MPAESHRIYPCVSCLFHHSVSHGDVEAVGICTRDEIRLYLGAEGAFPSSEQACHRREMSLHLASDGLCPPHEDTDVPEEFAGAYEYLCKLPVRLLSESLYRHRLRALRGQTSALDLYITVICVRSCRKYAESHQDIIVLDIFECLRHGLGKKCLVIYYVV